MGKSEIGADGSEYHPGERRDVLRVLGSAAAIGGLLPQIAGVVSAGDGENGDDDGQGSESGVSGDAYTTPPSGGYLNNVEWIAVDDENDNQVTWELNTHPNPGNLPIDVCTDIQNGNELCVKTADLVQVGPRPCPFGQTPTLYSTEITIQEYEAGNIRTDFSIWIGIDQNGCIYAGQEDVGACFTAGQCQVQDMYVDVVPNPAAVVDALQEVTDWIDNNDDVLKIVGSALTIIGLIVLAPILAAVVFGLLATAGLVS